VCNSVHCIKIEVAFQMKMYNIGEEGKLEIWLIIP